MASDPQSRLRRAAPDDIPFIMETERLDGYDQVVGRWDEARHRKEIAGTDCTYFVGLCEMLGGAASLRPGARDARPPEEVLLGFAILRGWASPERVTMIKRIAVLEPGQGYGTILLKLVIDEVFRTTDAHRLWLGVFPENLRARRAYERIGFVAEGVARGSAFFGGVYRDELTMAVLRPEWQARST